MKYFTFSVLLIALTASAHATEASREASRLSVCKSINVIHDILGQNAIGNLSTRLAGWIDSGGDKGRCAMLGEIKAYGDIIRGQVRKISGIVVTTWPVGSDEQNASLKLANYAMDFNLNSDGGELYCGAGNGLDEGNSNILMNESSVFFETRTLSSVSDYWDKQQTFTTRDMLYRRNMSDIQASANRLSEKLHCSVRD